jgi:predicted nucleic acid-binding protein
MPDRPGWMPDRPGWVVDASVAVKWLVPESLDAEASAVLHVARAGRIRVHVPEIWLAEIASSLWKKTRRPAGNRLDVRIAAKLLESARRLRVTVHSHEALAVGAFGLACQSGITVYDALYAALALSRGLPLVTADDRLADRLEAVGSGGHVVRLRDVPAFLDAEGP